MSLLKISGFSKMQNVLFLVLGLSLLSPELLFSQKKCYTDDYHRYLESNGYVESNKRFESWLQQASGRRSDRLESYRTKNNKYIIPVVVHVVHLGEPVGSGSNISREQVISQILVLNEDYQRLNKDTINTPEEFRGVASGIEIEFVLAKRDPFGFPTDGITRTRGSLNSYSILGNNSIELKSEVYWPAEDYLNIWVANLSGGFIGLASFPQSDLPGSSDPETNRLLDGVIIDNEAFGSSEYGDFPGLNDQYNLGRTTTHEVGHFLGLRHIWGDEEGFCDRDDFCPDTPSSDASSSGCPDLKVTCGSPDMYQNYMDYTDDRCMNIFTTCQIGRMQVVLENSPRRKSLLTSPGAVPPPGFEADLALSRIVAPVAVSCSGNINPIVEVANFGEATVEEILFEYTWDGLTVFTHTVSGLDLQKGQKQLIGLPVTDLDEGRYAFMVTVTELNAVIADSDPFNNTESIEFILNNERERVPLIETFSQNQPESAWITYNPDGRITWENVSVRGSGNNNNAIGISYFSNNQIGQKDWLVSPVIDLSGAISPKITFRVAYAFNNRNDQLRIVVSDDCGKQYSKLIYQKEGEELKTVTRDTDWRPASAADWRLEEVDLSQFAGNQNVRVAFVATNAGGNNLYLDDIEFYLTDSPLIDDDRRNLFYLYPNPANDKRFRMTFKLEEREDLDIIIYDQTGRRIYQKDFPFTLNQTLDFDLSSHPEGIYFIKVTGATIQQIEKLVIL
jgi:hypothetical protein